MVEQVRGTLESTPDAGSIRLGAGVRLGYFAQHAMEVLEAQKTVLQTLEKSFPLASGGSLRNLAGCFGFSGDHRHPLPESSVELLRRLRAAACRRA
jgi:ATPase subunit of ABC transporter with duplicated ATPase domains